VGVLSRPQSHVADFYRELGDLFGVTLSPHNRWAGSKVLRERWRRHTESPLVRPVLVIDEAQEMYPATLNELRFLASRLTGACAGMTNLAARIYLSKVSNSVVGTEAEAASTSAADSGNTFRYDPTDNQYIFNLATKALSAGTWQLRIDPGDGVANRTVLISLRK